MTVGYLALIEGVKHLFFTRLGQRPARPKSRTRRLRKRVQRRAARFSHAGRLGPQH